MATAQETENVITLKGSTEIVTEFFEYSINNILYQRGLYPPESFTRVPKYGLTMLISTDNTLQHYLKNFLEQMTAWVEHGEVQKLVLVITGVDSGHVLERWVFNVETEKDVITEAKKGNKPSRVKSQKEISSEIQAIIRQIVASVTFLPLLNEPCSFDLLVYTDREADVPMEWEESDPKIISNSTEVKLRSFSTKVHRVDAMVAYKNTEDDDDI